MRARIARGVATGSLALVLAGCAATSSVPSGPAESTGVARTRVEERAPDEAVSESAAIERTSPPFPELEPAPPPEPPLTASSSLGRHDAHRDASLRLVIAGLDADAAGEASRALASYQRAASLDATNPIAFLALARHHIAAGRPEDASAFLDQARSLFESEGQVGSAVDVFGLGIRAWIDRAQGRDAEADARFDAARALSPTIWQDELLSPAELR